MIDHAYAHLVGTTVGVKADDGSIRAATVMTPEVGQDHNDLLVLLGDSTWSTVKYMSTYRADFVNALILPSQAVSTD